MKSDWREVSLSEVASEITVGHVGSMADEYVDTGVPMLRSLNIEPLRIKSDELKYIPREFHEKLKKSQLKAGDVVIVRTGKPGACAVVPEWLNNCNCSDLVIVRCGPDLHNRFLSYYVNTAATNHISAHLVGAVQQHFNVGSAKTLRLRLPPFAEQKRIAGILGALDDKIELNRKMNETLEQVVRALFKSWFVDFDPVHDKAAGRRPAGMDKATAALFPDSFQDSELGKIPKGWKTSTIGQKLTTILGGTPSRAKPEYWTNGTVAWINSGKANEFRITDPSEWITKEALDNSATKLLPKRTTILAITGATLGQVSVTEIECCANQSVIGVISSNQFPTEYIYPWINEKIGTLIASQTGGAQQHVNKGNVEDLPLLCPDTKNIEAYLAVTKPIFDKIANNCFQSRTLADLRDAILPKLLSGEISA